MRGSSKIALYVVFFLLLSATYAPSKRRSRKYSTMKKKLSTVEHEKRQVRKKVHQLKKQEKTLAGEIEIIEGKLSLTNKKYERVQRNLVKARMQRRYYEGLLDQTRHKLSLRKAALAKRLVEVYKYGKVQPVAVLASASSMWDLVSRTYYLGRVMDQDAVLIQEIEQEALLIKDKKEQKKRQEQAVRRLEREIKQVKERLATVRGEKKRFRQKISHNRAFYERMLAELEATSNEIQRWLQAHTYRYSGKNYWTGKWIRPVPGRITSRFGMRKHPILHRYRMHTGVDIGARYGMPVKAAAGGEIIKAGWWRGYGRVVIIAHSSSVTTLYAHLSAITVRVGQIVSAGQVVGRVGCTGLCTGPHLHFEVRKHGRPVNPL